MTGSARRDRNWADIRLRTILASCTKTPELGKSREIILGEILFAHYRSDVIDPDRMRIDPARLDAIARLGF